MLQVDIKFQCSMGMVKILFFSVSANCLKTINHLSSSSVNAPDILFQFTGTY